MLTLDNDDVSFLTNTLSYNFGTFENEFVSPICNNEFGQLAHPTEIRRFVEQMQDLMGFAHTKAIPESHFPALKRLLIYQRRKKAKQIEEIKARTPSTEVVTMLEEHLAPFDKLMNAPWFAATKALPMPRILDYLTLERVEIVYKNRVAFQPRKYDEKFHTLLAPELCLKDLEYYRSQCDLRGLSVGVAYLDIDDFKIKFNTPYGESHVDQFVLPRFMEAFEVHFFSHGHGYRYGGDEYAVIMPNATLGSATALLNGFQERISSLEYRGVNEKISVSIGLCVADPDCILTNQELLERATKAKNFAKSHGKNGLATFKGQSFADGDIYRT